MATRPSSSKSSIKALSERERRFVDAFCGEAAGNGTLAARLAGYQGNPKVLGVQSTRLLAKASVQGAIATLTEKAERASIADASERREIITGMLRDSAQEPQARLKAADILNKMDGLYIQKHDVKLSRGLDDILEEVASLERQGASA